MLMMWSLRISYQSLPAALQAVPTINPRPWLWLILFWRVGFGFTMA